MSKHESFITLWNFMEISEKKRLMQQFLRQHGDHFSREDFVRFLAHTYDRAVHDASGSPNPENRRRPV